MAEPSEMRLKFGLGRGRLTHDKPKHHYPIENQALERLGNSNFKVSLASMQGKRDEMEDAHSALLSFKNHSNSGFFGVFDGHNGTQASVWASKSVGVGFESVDDLHSSSALRKRLLELDAKYMEEHTDENPGTTAVFAVITRNKDGKKPYKMIVGNLGDSRCIVGHYSNNEITVMTKDHKPDNPEEKSRIEAAGGTVACGRINGHLAVARAFGDSAYKKNSKISQEKQMICCVADFTEIELDEDDFVFICCDGIFEAYKNEEAIQFIQSQMKETKDTAKILSNLLYSVLKKGSKDNMTAMVIELQDGSDYNKPLEFIPGEYHENAHDIWINAYKRDCDRYGITIEEAKKLHLKYKAERGESGSTPADESPSSTPMITLQSSKTRRGMLNTSGLSGSSTSLNSPSTNTTTTTTSSSTTPVTPTNTNGGTAMNFSGGFGSRAASKQSIPPVSSETSSSDKKSSSSKSKSSSSDKKDKSDKDKTDKDKSDKKSKSSSSDKDKSDKDKDKSSDKDKSDKDKPSSSDKDKSSTPSSPSTKKSSPKTEDKNSDKDKDKTSSSSSSTSNAVSSSTMKASKSSSKDKDKEKSSSSSKDKDKDKDKTSSSKDKDKKK
eukprot:TRINITY_DN3294_c2_g1_i1.p1 TRINITY_DN3294_c2_g1~~TRINITY_DN3294_c2_g1_i1.p1  ORF type:complete len:608 (-),score=247.48 TRINITY_DN3294_c2_g1_i1:647-2470(-)